MTTMASTNCWEASYLTQLQQSVISHTHCAAAFRVEQLARFLKQGFPTRRDEAWKYTDISALLKHPFGLMPPVCQVSQSQLQPYFIHNTQRFVFVNGYFVPSLSDVSLLGQTGWFCNVLQALQNEPERYQQLLQQFEHPETAFATLNGALFTDGCVIVLPANAIQSMPVHLLHVNTANHRSCMQQLRHHFVLEPQSELVVFEDYVSLDLISSSAKQFTNVVTQIVVGANARMTHYKLQRTSHQDIHIAYNHITQQQDSLVKTYNISVGANISRDDLQVDLAQPGARCELYGLYQVQGEQRADHHSQIIHGVPHCSSKQHYKGVLDDRSQAVFDAKVVVKPNATQSFAHQANQNIVLSPHAQINTKPTMEIYNDDVSASHGATVGDLDEQALFYLQSRGIEADKAKQMLVRGFANEILNHLPNPEIATLIQAQVSG